MSETVTIVGPPTSGAVPNFVSGRFNGAIRSRSVSSAQGCTRRPLAGGAVSRNVTTGLLLRGTALLQLRRSARAAAISPTTSTAAGSGGAVRLPNVREKDTETEKNRSLILALPATCQGVGPANRPVNETPSSNRPRYRSAKAAPISTSKANGVN